MWIWSSRLECRRRTTLRHFQPKHELATTQLQAFLGYAAIGRSTPDERQSIRRLELQSLDRAEHRRHRAARQTQEHGQEKHAAFCVLIRMEKQCTKQKISFWKREKRYQMQHCKRQRQRLLLLHRRRALSSSPATTIVVAVFRSGFVRRRLGRHSHLVVERSLCGVHSDSGEVSGAFGIREKASAGIGSIVAVTASFRLWMVDCWLIVVKKLDCYFKFESFRIRKDKIMNCTSIWR